jgi:hypothetical protein
MDSVIYNPDGTIDWNANGWPEPNGSYDGNLDGYSTENMPDEIFDQWNEECMELDIEWSADY